MKTGPNYFLMIFFEQLDHRENMLGRLCRKPTPNGPSECCLLHRLYAVWGCVRLEITLLAVIDLLLSKSGNLDLAYI